jgi:hypothetical protein
MIEKERKRIHNLVGVLQRRVYRSVSSTEGKQRLKVDWKAYILDGQLVEGIDDGVIGSSIVPCHYYRVVDDCIE